MSLILPPGAVVRVSRGNFEPARFEEADRMIRHTGEYLIPAVQHLGGLAAYFAGTSPAGSVVNVSVWESEAAAKQMDGLKEMTVRAREEAQAVGVGFIPIVNYPIAWKL